MTKFYQRKFFKAGIPLILFVVGGSFALTTTTQIKYTLINRRNDAGGKLTREMRRKIVSTDAFQDPDELPKKPLISQRQIEKLSADPFVKRALEEALNNPLPKKLDKNDPDYEKNLEKWIELKNKKGFSLEEEYIKMRQKLDINNWENKRLPRPYEEKDETD